MWCEANTQGCAILRGICEGAINCAVALRKQSASVARNDYGSLPRDVGFGGLRYR
jgi:hypothetical protein